VSGRSVHRITKQKLGSSIDLVTFEFDGGRLEILQYIYWDELIARARPDRMIDDWRGGECWFLPEAAAHAFGVRADDPNVVVYGIR
jgi:hypothetical protein